MDVETERKAPAPGLKEKDEEEISGIGTEEEEEEEERWLDRGCLQQTAVTMGQEPVCSPHRQGSGCTREPWKGQELRQGVPGRGACENGKGQHSPACPGKEVEKAKKGPVGREPRF